jgi:hypothetical protein
MFLIVPVTAYSQPAASNDSSENIFGNLTTVKPDLELPLSLPLNQYIYFLIFIAFVIIIIITLIVSALIAQKSKTDPDPFVLKFFDIIRDGDYYPSLPRLQFLVWTFVISFVYLSIYLIRISSGESDAPIVDNNLLILLGISIASPLISNVISGNKYSKHVPEYSTPGHEGAIDRKPFKTMLLENHKPALFRYQMFLWTFIGVTIFLSLFAVNVFDYVHRYELCVSKAVCIQDDKVEALAIPKIDNMLVVLMGLSQTGYLGGKVVARTPAIISKVVPALNDKLVIFGHNFGVARKANGENDEISSGSVLINDIVVAGHKDNGVTWLDTKIEFTVPEAFRNKSFKLGVVVDDLVFLEYDYVLKN